MPQEMIIGSAHVAALNITTANCTYFVKYLIKESDLV